MEAGLWIYDDQNRLRFGPGTSNVTVLGIIETTKSNGSVTNPLLAKGTPIVVSAYAIAGTSFSVPEITFSGNTMSWAFRVNGANYNQPVRIAYGVRA